MDYLKQYSIPFKGMLDGLHEYEFKLGNDFFKRFNESPIQDAEIQAIIQADKQGSLMSVELQIQGSMRTGCDRCLSEIELELKANYQFVLKRSEGESDDPDLFFIQPDASEWLIADVLYEYSCLSIPIVKEIDCSSMKNPPCNQEVLQRIQKEENNPESNPLWDELRRLNLK
ncbi:MAG: hypothetical protein HOP11_05360 [Saprospiraceae bacterium]|nr:hypothetical protein [Saprospiraceae bacterium]